MSPSQHFDSQCIPIQFYWWSSHLWCDSYYWFAIDDDNCSSVYRWIVVSTTTICNVHAPPVASDATSPNQRPIDKTWLLIAIYIRSTSHKLIQWMKITMIHKIKPDMHCMQCNCSGRLRLVDNSCTDQMCSSLQSVSRVKIAILLNLLLLLLLHRNTKHHHAFNSTCDSGHLHSNV